MDYSSIPLCLLLLLAVFVSTTTLFSPNVVFHQENDVVSVRSPLPTELTYLSSVGAGFFLVGLLCCSALMSSSSARRSKVWLVFGFFAYLLCSHASKLLWHGEGFVGRAFHLQLLQQNIAALTMTVLAIFLSHRHDASIKRNN